MDQVPNSPSVADPFPDPTRPKMPPFRSIPPPEHISIEVWQDSYYDATDSAPMGAFVQRPDGPCSLETGRLTDGEWHTPGPWKQV